MLGDDVFGNMMQVLLLFLSAISCIKVNAIATHDNAL